jgi:hypothetical protein
LLLEICRAVVGCQGYRKAEQITRPFVP